TLGRETFYWEKSWRAGDTDCGGEWFLATQFDWLRLGDGPRGNAVEQHDFRRVIHLDVIVAQPRRMAIVANKSRPAKAVPVNVAADASSLSARRRFDCGFAFFLRGDLEVHVRLGMHDRDEGTAAGELPVPNRPDRVFLAGPRTEPRRPRIDPELDRHWMVRV